MQVESVLLVLSLLFFASIFTDRIGYRFGVPALLLFLALLFGGLKAGVLLVLAAILLWGLSQWISSHIF